MRSNNGVLVVTVLPLVANLTTVLCNLELYSLALSILWARSTVLWANMLLRTHRYCNHRFSCDWSCDHPLFFVFRLFRFFRSFFFFSPEVPVQRVEPLAHPAYGLIPLSRLPALFVLHQEMREAGKVSGRPFRGPDWLVLFRV